MIKVVLSAHASLRLMFSAGVILLASVLLSSCSRTPDMLHHEQILAFGTLVDISIWDRDADKAAKASAELIRLFNDLHQRWHAWQPSPVTAINAQLSEGKAALIDSDIADLIRQAQTLSAKSGGLFNPAIGRLIALWGFHSDDPPQGPPPDPGAIREILSHLPRMDELHLAGNALSSDNPLTQFDFGAIGKGYAVDLAISQLKQAGIANAIVNLGGDLCAIGRHGERPWRVGIRNPRGPGVLASLEIDGDECVFTSGDYERYYDYEGRRYHHIIDPRTGYPPRGATSVTVIGQLGVLTEPSATSMLIAGPEHWPAVARAMGASQVMLVAEDGSVHLTPTMQKRIKIEAEPRPKLIVRELP